MAIQNADLPPSVTIEKADHESEEYVMNIGPQHPSTHGVLRLVAKLDGEYIKEIVPVLGYIHRGIEKMGESQTYLQYIHLTDRMDYLASHFNNLCVCLAIEKAMDIGVPERAEYIRVIVCELQRIESHLLWWGVLGMDLGAITAFLYGFREREMIADIFDELCGARLTTNYFRPGGSFADLPENFIPRVNSFLDQMEKMIEEYDTLLTNNIILHERTKGVGVLSKEKAVAFGCTGPFARGSGVDFDLRKHVPYSAYDRFDFEVPLGKVGDSFDRYMVRMLEIRESIKIIKQAIKGLPDGPYRSKEVPRYKLPKGSHYAEVETPRGIFSTYLVSDGKSQNPYRVKNRSPSFSNLSVMNELAKGLKLADLITIMSTMDLVIPDIDR